MAVTDSARTSGAGPGVTLAERLQRGDREAFVAAADEHRARLLQLVSRFVGSREDAEDAVQEAVLVAYRRMRTFRGEAAFGTWIGRIAIRQALRLSRRRRRPVAEVNERDAAPTASEGPDEGVALRDAVSQLPDKLRAPVVLRFYAGLSGQEIAELLDWSQSTVYTRLYRGLERLRRDLGDWSEP